MIKIGITAGESAVAGELIRLLINHPDVEICWIESKTMPGRQVELYHKGLIGEFEMPFTAGGSLSAIDVLFAGEELPASLPDELMVIDYAGRYRGKCGSGQWIYGVPELNRRRIVHDCNRVTCPTPDNYAILLALLPLAKNLLLNGHIAANCIVDMDFSGSNKDDELKNAIATLQSSSNFDLQVNRQVGNDAKRKCVAKVDLDCTVEENLIKKLFLDYYDDHNLTHISERYVDDTDVLNTAKALLFLNAKAGRLNITVALDPLVKGTAAVAVHNMNLLCGLHERVGLHLKADI